MRLVVISGHSGSGKTSALNILEDAGFACIDNLPASLLQNLISQLGKGASKKEKKLAVGIDARNLLGDLSTIAEILKKIRADGVQVDVIFMYARRPDLVRRYSETRRKHPLSSSGVSLMEAIELEDSLLAPIAKITNQKVDTTGLSQNQLRGLIKRIVEPDNVNYMAILFESFGYKRGLPENSDFIFDVRCLPNPYWKAELRHKTGLEPAVIQFLEAHVEVAAMLADIVGFLDRWIPKFQENNRSYLTISIGCTGGQHRSVYMANRLYVHYSENQPAVQVGHKEL
ncbi:MAG: RNase adapter RapZ [Cellvibrionales bacterium TMED148]|nr:RNase adapter RapZ [Porticoccaceae bacterium]RPG91213.1 MAG: RNase adapter RapZ [Cellvibrionales bacterium TMED148]